VLDLVEKQIDYDEDDESAEVTYCTKDLRVRLAKWLSKT